MSCTFTVWIIAERIGLLAFSPPSPTLSPSHAARRPALRRSPRVVLCGVGNGCFHAQRACLHVDWHAASTDLDGLDALVRW
jgi:hypothetical protein